MSETRPDRPAPENEPSAPIPTDGTHPKRAPESVEPRVGRGLTKKGRVRATRASWAWISIILAAILVIAMLIFIGQNSQKVALNFLGFDGRFPLGLTLLFATVVGMLLVALPGTVRIVELHRALRKNERDTKNR
ncbi:lipopolysaccharide assembly LapA domain-containing protein [Aeromicrobium sp.]|uniref:LapA family protein n=1 Tax=Aeromicrobium sp. TaxID=1871063 RepID=UPI0019C65935|nr:lipopolysaccharide assembly protein LapA domain-containing protein [Aeromicrobium sp.]MBC7633256.1 DUF1049 domain-containing protein [Aeromicrobium sp.]